MTYSLLILALFIWPFGQLLNWQLPEASLTLYPLDLVCALLAFSMLISPKNRLIIIGDPLFKPLMYFLAAALLSLLFNLNLVIEGGLYFSLFYFARLCIYPAVYFAIKQSKIKRLLPYILISFATFCAFGALQYFFLPDMRYLKLLGFDDHYFRLIGSFFDPNFTGAVFAGSALMLIGLGHWLFSLLPLILLALTFSRASYLVFFAGLLYLLYLKKQKTLLFFVLILVVAVYLIPKPFGEGVNLARTFSIYSRFESWRSGIDLFLQKPFFGWGYNTLRGLAGQRFQIDNSFLYLAATTGIVGLATFVNLLKAIFIIAKSVPQRIFLISILAHSLFNNSLLYIWIYFIFWVILGLPSREYKES
ncbi:MAG: O-antigen polymerase [Candidatus Collierbacteria bacterium GW2011_GWB1_44_6]|uniref:O-antigen polymerase n=2 Tax=Candidatus Collieribacteriota TaxID=1752725 RepID=A0A0G1MP89_9BACT|nr:MAG: O-antigen polymerase [Candidatus Collierbacteria bacterium GW2011_GWC2_43_12]KKT73844.1 MAG: O-antigen polymerase [Candidatus Collierbacteria bacterium GW2011_GWB1_44_6]KKT84132.1 MAG: hypothetical protein UW80_C0001G0012 [Microgenomates group bacterium GW2011_GWC1_44_9]